MSHTLVDINVYKNLNCSYPYIFLLMSLHVNFMLLHQQYDPFFIGYVNNANISLMQANENI